MSLSSLTTRCACGMERRHVGSGYVFYMRGVKCKAGECGGRKQTIQPAHRAPDRTGRWSRQS